MGWQGKDLSTDFRGGGFISLDNLLYFARNFQKSFQDLLRKQEGDRAMWEYPFAVIGVNITFMLIQMLDLESGKLAYRLKSEGATILMAAGDTFRAAPSDQLGIWAERTGCEIVLAEKEKAKASSGR
ncbi:hypothetical protein L2E82_47489 [Cichorium intybus]|uniref:Uncharacterized protein n=1 Tax=Cichorium intybus TaxID=13427 RepID=A0ACB8YX44_CICIN|nr:hypothetical protein L2E82_47489 [Cichorium intybus]